MSDGQIRDSDVRAWRYTQAEQPVAEGKRRRGKPRPKPIVEPVDDGAD